MKQILVHISRNMQQRFSENNYNLSGFVLRAPAMCNDDHDNDSDFNDDIAFPGVVLETSVDVYN